MNEILSSFERGKTKYNYILSQLKNNSAGLSSFGKPTGIETQLREAFVSGTKEFRVFYLVSKNDKIELRTKKFKRKQVTG